MLLRQLARTQPSETIAVSSALLSKPAESPLVRLLLSALLLVAILFGLLAPGLVQGIIPAGAAPTPLSEASLIEVAGQPVLVVFDYTPAMAGALHQTAETLMRRLADQNSPAILTSQSAAGLALGNQAAAGHDLLRADDLGFIPGGALGVRRLGRCLQDSASCQTLFGQPIAPETADRLANIALVMVITAERDNLLAWIEQLDAPRTTSLAAIVTPALEPVTGPYLATGQLTDVFVGWGTASNGDSENASTSITALVLSQWLVAAVIIAAALFYLVTGTVLKRRV